MQSGLRQMELWMRTNVFHSLLSLCNIEMKEGAYFVFALVLAAPLRAVLRPIHELRCGAYLFDAICEQKRHN